MAMIAGLGMMCLSSSVGAALMMGGGGGEDDGGSGAGGANNQDNTPTIPSGQYVKVVHTVAQDNNAPGNADDKNKVLNLAELEVFAPGGTTSLAAGKTVTGTNLWSAFPGSYLVDGSMSNFSHTAGGAEIDYFLVDLGSVQEIEKIVIYDRPGYFVRLNGVKVQIIGADGTTVVEETPLITTASSSNTYTFTFPGTTWA